MASIILKSIASPTQLSDSPILDTIKPLNYHDWLKNNVAVIPDNAEQQYQKYLLSWYSSKNQQSTINADSLKADYISLLKRVSVLFQNDPEFERFTKINFDSETDLRIAIPFYAKKIKEIALYFASKRNDIKKSKIQYNLIGSSNGLEKLLTDNILKAFTKNSAHISKQEVFSVVPELSSISTDFSIEIEELYDMSNPFIDNQYYALSSTNPLIFVLDDYINNFYEVLNLDDVPLSGLSNPLARFSLCETPEELNESFLAQLGENRIGNDIHQLSGGYFAPKIVDVSMNLQATDNYFYWFGGEYNREIPEGKFVNKSIQDIDWTNATGGSAINVSDIIWKNVGNISVEGAWLMDSDHVVVRDNMVATMTNGKQFKFPYSGIGTSAENLEWSGPKITDEEEPSRKFFPSESSFIANQEKIKDLYWSNFSSISTVNDIDIQSTSLALYASGSPIYRNADKILVRTDTDLDKIHDTNPDNVFQGGLEEAWLFDLTQTELPVIPGTTNIYYPLTSFSSADDLFFLYESGLSQPLSSINIAAFAGAIAGSNFDDSDVLIKLNSVCGPEIEAAFLKGVPLSSFNTNKDSCACDGDYTNYYTDWKFKDGVTQPSLSFKASPGQFVRFVWTGPKTDLNDVIPGYMHDQSCEYYKLPNHPSILDTNFLNKSKKDVYEQWKKCSCKSVNHSPLGHGGQTLLHYRVVPDFVAEDTSLPANFSFNTWRGSDGNPYQTSNGLAWFRTNNLLESDIGWSDGSWLTNTDETFYLETGKTYWYYRSDINRCGFDLPYIIVNKCYQTCMVPDCDQTNCIPVWTKAVLNDSGSWEETSEVSDMMMDSGSFYTFRHADAFNFSQSRLLVNNNFITSASYISLSSGDPTISYSDLESSVQSINFTIKIPLSGTTPYWGKSNKQHNYSKFDYRLEHDYLQITQPIPSDIVLSNGTTVEYKSPCANCFTWTQPLIFDVQQPIRQWNKILVDDCVRSDILNNLHNACNNSCDISINSCYSDCLEQDICGCSKTCYHTKTGITATNIPSDMIFNTELSGVPVFIDYYARSPYTLNFTVEDITDGGIYVPPVSTLFSQATEPWKNIINDWKPFSALIPSSELFSAADRGLFVPSQISTGKWELRNGQYELDSSTRSTSSIDLIRNESDLSVISTDSSWMKRGKMINVDKNQTYYPYTTLPFSDIGLGENYILDTTELSSNFRGQQFLDCGERSYYTNLPYITGNVIDYHQDIWGNQYFLVNDDDTTRMENASFSTIYLKAIDGTISML